MPAVQRLNLRGNRIVHDPIFHIKDGYFFEVPGWPKWLWENHYHKLSDVPEWLRHAYPSITNVAENYSAQSGKILIWQPFGSPKNLYEAGTGFCISRYMIIEVVGAVILACVCLMFAKRMRDGDRARGTVWNMLEGILFFLRDDVANPAIRLDWARRLISFVPLLWTMFLFILTMNLFGLVPWAGSPTAAWSVTFAMAAVTLFVGMIDGMLHFGPIGFWTHFVPHMELPSFAVPVIYHSVIPH